MNLALKIPPPLVALGCAACMAGLAFGLPLAPLVIPAAVISVIVVLGLSIMLLGVLSFKRAKTTVNPLQPQQASTLVISGIYRFTRNPMYLGMAFLLLAWALWLGELSTLVFVVLFMAYIQYFQIKPEERHLAHLFGEPYDAYLGDVRRWL